MEASKQTLIFSASAKPPPSSRIRPHGTLCTTSSHLTRAFLGPGFPLPGPPRQQNQLGLSSGIINKKHVTKMAAVASDT